MLIPLHAFVTGDTLGVVVLAQHTDTIEQLARTIQHAVAMRVSPLAHPVVVARGEILDPRTTIAAARLSALERIDLREGPP